MTPRPGLSDLEVPGLVRLGFELSLQLRDLHVLGAAKAYFKGLGFFFFWGGGGLRVFLPPTWFRSSGFRFSGLTLGGTGFRSYK